MASRSEADESTAFGPLLRRYRLEAGLTQEALADKAGVSVRAVQTLERGEHRPYGDTVDRLARALGLSGERLLRLQRAARPRPRSLADQPARVAATEAEATGRDGDSAGRPPALPERIFTNLPIALTTFVGREREMADTRALLEETRLLTLTGTGGCGKTRLALELSRTLLGSFPDGVWLVDLAPLSDQGLVAPAVARVLGVTEQGGIPIVDSLVGALRSKRLLLIMDNCEHVLDASARLVEALLRACPDVRVLATSRQALGILGEACYRMPSLSLPDDSGLTQLGGLIGSESVRLFADRARAVAPGFQVTVGNASAVAQICRRLDGIPLAIELAAARVGGLSVEQISRRLDDRFHLLTGGSRVSLRRQQTLKAAIDWGYDLLAEPERVLFRRLAVFVGGFALEAAEQVCCDRPDSASDLGCHDVLDLLLRLVDCSLVLVEDVGEGRYRLLETIREYAHEKLLASGEAESLRDRHLGWYLALAETGASELFGPRQRRWLDDLELEHDNLRAALDWSLRADDSGPSLRLAAALGEFWVRGWWHLAEGRERMASVLARPGGESRARGRTLIRAGELESADGNWSRAREWYAECLSLARANDDRRLVAESLLHLSFIAGDLGDVEQAYSLRREAVDLARELGEKGVIAQTTWDLAAALFQMGRLEESRALANESLGAYTAVGNAEGIALALLRLGLIALAVGSLDSARRLAEDGLAKARDAHAWRVVVQLLGLRGDVARAEGDRETSRQRYREGLELAKRQPGDRQLTVSLLVRIAGLAAADGLAERSARLFGAVHGWHEARGLRALYQPHAGYERDEETARSAIGEAAFAREWAEGQAMTLDEAIEHALSE